VSDGAKITVVIGAGAALRARLHGALGAAGVTVSAECASAAEAIEAAAREHPDVCVVDCRLPGGALAAAAAITSPRRAPKVLVVGGHGSDAERRAAVLAGASDYLPGEPDDATLVTAITQSVNEMRP
jgi:DNA-binding NarL/FixJ family response regulator